MKVIGADSLKATLGSNHGKRMVFNIITGQIVESDGELIAEEVRRNYYDKLLSALLLNGMFNEEAKVRKWRMLAIEGSLTPAQISFS